MAEPIAFKYRVFISYSHTDTDWAKWLHRGLEGFRIDKDLVGRETSTGTIPPALRPVFRDRDEFTAGHTLTEQTIAALDASAALIVICSPSSAKSQYVNEEVRIFRSRLSGRPVTPLIVAGKPGDPEHECFPPALRFKLDSKGRIIKKCVEVLAADAREEGDGKDLALAKVIAGLLGLSSDDVFRRAERERHAAARRRRRLQALFGILALLLVLGAIGWFNQDYLKEQYYWRAVMGPNVLTAAEEQALKPGDQFTECQRGCPTMVIIPAGTFTMGSPAGEGQENERPQHEQTIARPFAVGKYELTFAEWDACATAGSCPPLPDSGWGGDARPVINVSWKEAKEYLAWLSRVTGKTYRLLTEAEWEYAARGGTTTSRFFGDQRASVDNAYSVLFQDPQAELDDYAWHIANAHGSTHPVGEKKPNPFGLYDVYGNADEWVEDPWREYAASASAELTPDRGFDERGFPKPLFPDFFGGASLQRTMRGGSAASDRFGMSSAYREHRREDSRNPYTGFRVARDID